VLKHERTALLCVTLEAGFVSAQKRKAASFQLLLNIRRRTFDRDSFVRLVTICATHFAFEHRMVVRQGERCANFQMTLETRLRRFTRIDDRVRRAAAFHVQTPRSMAGLAAHVRGLLGSFAAFRAGVAHDDLFCLQSCVGSSSEIPRDLFVARCAFLRADELRTGNAGRSKNCAVCRAARKQNYSQCDYCSSPPQNFLALTMCPSS